MNKECSNYESCVNFKPKHEPLPEMCVGKVWTLNQPGNPWHGYKVKCARMDGAYDEYEQFIDDTDGELMAFSHPKSNRTQEYSGGDPIINCIDRRFWTGELCGEKVRCYEDSMEQIIASYLNGSWEIVVYNNDTIHDKLWLNAIKDAGIPIMPWEQIQNNQDGRFDPPEE